MRNGNATNTEATGRPIQLRRSSVVVIPPMQVCPGDLLVYSKALTHAGNISGISLLNEPLKGLHYYAILQAVFFSVHQIVYVLSTYFRFRWFN